jgi:galactokinase
VADSREEADKSGNVRAEYNRRVVECRLAARFLGLALTLNGVRALGDVVKGVKDWNAADLISALAQTAPERVDAGLVKAASQLGLTPEALAHELLGDSDPRVALDLHGPLEILKRARHVLSETERVLQAVRELEAGRLAEMGALMNESHRSLAEDFNCSTSRLDRMVSCARGAGALGARLTGAGFGGSIVALCHADDAPGVIAALDRDYYSALRIPPESARTVLHASAGADLVELASA